MADMSQSLTIEKVGEAPHPDNESTLHGHHVYDAGQHVGAFTVQTKQGRVQGFKTKGLRTQHMSAVLAHVQSAYGNTMMPKAAMPAESAAPLQKAEYFKRLVQYIGQLGTNAKQAGKSTYDREMSDPNVNITLRRDGKLAQIKAGPVKMSAVPDARRKQIRREVTMMDAAPGAKYADTDTEKYTAMADGRVSKIQFFAKASLEFADALAKAGIIIAPQKLEHMGSLFDYKTLGQGNIATPQGDLPRTPISTAASATKYDQIVDHTTRNLKSKANQRLLDEGMKHHGHLWYHLDPLHAAFKERLGEDAGTKRFNLFARTVAATSPNSEFSANMRRAGALMPFMVHGHRSRILSSNEGINGLASPGLGNTAHRNYASALQNAREGKPHLFSEPLKADGFADNLSGNFRPLTADRHFLRQAGHHQDSAGSVVYQAVEDATAAYAKNLARRGSLPVASDRSATAPFQSALWIGDALNGRVKSPPHPALKVFEDEIHRTAGKMGIHPKEALNRFIDGHLHQFGGGMPGLHEALTQTGTSGEQRVAKALHITGDQFSMPVDGMAEQHFIQLKVAHPTGKKTDVLLSRTSDHPEHQWEVSPAHPVALTALGRGAMREVANHLKQHFGVQRIVPPKSA